MKRLFIIFPVVFYVLLLTGCLHQLKTTAYEITVRVVAASLYVLNGTASATSASYNTTIQLVDSSGNILTGTESSAVASPAMVARVVDANGKVLDALGPTCAPTASPEPTPALVGTPVKGFHLSSPQTYTGAQVGDVAVIVSGSDGTVGALLAGNTPILQNSAGNAQYLNVTFHVMNPQDGTSVPFQVYSGDNFTGYCIVLYRYLSGGTDGISTVNSGTTGGTATFNTITTTLANSLSILALETGSTATAAYTTPSGYHLDCSEPGVSGTGFGATIWSQVIASPGATGAITSSLTNVNVWQTVQFALHQ